MIKTVHYYLIKNVHLYLVIYNNSKNINLDYLTKVKLKSLYLDCFDLKDFSFIQNLSGSAKKMFGGIG